MNEHASPDFERFDGLMDLVLEGVATPEQIDLFNDCLRRGADARARYIAYIDLHASLADSAGPLKDPAPADLPDVMSELIEQALAARRQHEIEDEANRLLAAQQAEDARNRRFELRRNAEPEPIKRVVVIPKAIVWLGLAAAIGLAATVFVTTTSSRPTVSTPPVVEAEPEATASRVVAHVVGSVDVVWADGFALRRGTALLVGDTVRLESGFAELLSAGGTRVILEGPCDLRASSDRRMTLRLGRLVADTSASDVLFTITTPRGDVVDMGAVFGVEVDESQSMRLAVFDGLVEVYSNGAATAQRVSEGRMAQMTQAGTGQLVITQLDTATDAAFAHTLVQAESPTFLYRRAVLASGPVAYWTFDDDVSRGVTNVAQPGTHDLRAFGQPEWVTDGIAGSAARVENLQRPYSYFETAPGDELPGGFSDFTVELWFKAERRGMSRLLDLYLADGGAFPLHAVTIELQDSRNRNVDPTWLAWSVRGVLSDPPAKTADVNVFSTDVYRTDRWYHVVYAKSGTTLRFYLDGELQAEVYKPGVLTAGCRAILGVASYINYSGGDGPRAYSGLLDEVAIYGKTLSEDEIAAHYLAGRPTH